MRNLFKLFYILLFIYIVLTLTACGEAEESVDWIVPMMTFAQGSNTAALYTGEINAARANSGEGVTPVIRTGQVTSAGITEASLIQNGAVKKTVKLSYNGDAEFLVRFRVVIDEFSGHSIVNRRLANASNDAADRILVLWKDSNGTWWDIRRSQIGGANTGGTNSQFVLNNGTNTNVTALKINKNTISQYASVDLYIVVLDPPAQNEEVAGYIITYYAELPDRYAGHFHGYEILASTSTAVAVE